MAGISNYLAEEDLLKILQGSYTSDTKIAELISTRTNGIEGLPYQFLPTVDRRILNNRTGRAELGISGRKYADKIFAQLPLLFLTPCKPLFMPDYNKSDREAGASAELSGAGDVMNTLKEGRFYSLENDFTEYWNYVNIMLQSVAIFMGIQDMPVHVNNGPAEPLGGVMWENEMAETEEAKIYFTGKENVLYYMDGLTSVSESFSNDTAESSLASAINGFSDQARELQFLFGKNGGVAGEMLNSAQDVTTSITQSLSSVASGLGGGIVGSLSNGGVNTVLNGGKIVFPEMWANSNYDRSYSIEIKLRTPDHDPLSVFLNIIKPYCKLLALVMPHVMDGYMSGFSSPFLVRAFSKGMFSVENGIISSMSVTKGAECQWTLDGLPTQLDISIEIKDLYSALSMSGSGYNSIKNAHDIVKNTAYMDFLANMAGTNLSETDIGTHISTYRQILFNDVTNIPGKIVNSISQGGTKFFSYLWNHL